MRRAAFAIVLGTACGLSAPAADAAVRRCLTPLAGGAQEGRTLVLAQRAAIGAWTRIVTAAHGPRFTGWRIAINKSMICGAAAASGVSCEARATPCVIEQAPANALPPRVRPEPKVIPVMPQPGRDKPLDI